MGLKGFQVMGTTPRKLNAKRKKKLFEQQKRRAKRRADFFKEREMGDSPSPNKVENQSTLVSGRKEKPEISFAQKAAETYDILLENNDYFE